MIFTFQNRLFTHNDFFLLAVLTQIGYILIIEGVTLCRLFLHVRTRDVINLCNTSDGKTIDPSMFSSLIVCFNKHIISQFFSHPYWAYLNCQKLLLYYLLYASLCPVTVDRNMVSVYPISDWCKEESEYPGCETVFSYRASLSWPCHFCSLPNSLLR